MIALGIKGEDMGVKPDQEFPLHDIVHGLIICLCISFPYFFFHFHLLCNNIRKRLNAGTVPANKEYAAGTVPANKEYAAGTSQMSVGAGWPCDGV